jgi:hypothetical protein
LKFKNGSDWPQHRLPPSIKTEPQIRRYVRTFLAAEAAERKIQAAESQGPAEIRKDMPLRIGRARYAVPRPRSQKEVEPL